MAVRVVVPHADLFLQRLEVLGEVVHAPAVTPLALVNEVAEPVPSHARPLLRDVIDLFAAVEVSQPGEHLRVVDA